LIFNFSSDRESTHEFVRRPPQRRQPAQGFGQAKAAPEADLHQTFILEPILTPSGLVDVGEDIPEVADLDLDLDLDTDTEEGFEPVEADPIDGEDLADDRPRGNPLYRKSGNRFSV
jgi:hypothetical protein